MTFRELRKQVRKGEVEADIIVNQGGIYVIQVSIGEDRHLLTHGRLCRSQVFHSLSECYETLADAGFHKAFVNQAFAHCEMVSQQYAGVPLVDRRIVCF